jgi:iron complex transport system substrate-binding protein
VKGEVFVQRTLGLTLAAAALLAFGATRPISADSVPQRVVSINLCADELLIALADPAQIADLSIYATDQNLAFLADEATHFRHDAGAAETVAAMAPDLVLAGRFSKRETRATLTTLGYHLVELEPARSIADSVAQIRKVASLLGHPERGEALIGRIDAARDRASTATRSLSGNRQSVAVYLRRGYVTGGNTLTDELLSIVGLDNAGSRLAGRTGGVVPLEKLVATPPDYLLVSSRQAPAEDQGSALLGHPALAALFPPEKRIALPDRLTVCGGPSLPAALDWLAGEARRVEGHP